MVESQLVYRNGVEVSWRCALLAYRASVGVGCGVDLGKNGRGQSKAEVPLPRCTGTLRSKCPDPSLGRSPKRRVDILFGICSCDSKTPARATSVSSLISIFPSPPSYRQYQHVREEAQGVRCQWRGGAKRSKEEKEKYRTGGIDSTPGSTPAGKGKGKGKGTGKGTKAAERDILVRQPLSYVNSALA